MSWARAAGLLLGVAADAVLGGSRGHALKHSHHPARTDLVVSYANAACGGENSRAALLTSAGIGLGYLLEQISREDPIVQLITTATTAWAVVNGESLAEQGAILSRELNSGDLSAARIRLSTMDKGLMGLANLGQTGLSRIAVETIADRTSTNAVGPLLWGAIAGAPGLLGYAALRALSTHSDWANRLDTLTNFLPARVTALLTVGCAPAVGGSAHGAWRVWRRDAAPLSNVEQPQTAFAGALEVRLGGRLGDSQRSGRPILGDGQGPDAGHVTRAVELSRLVSFAATAIAATVAVLVNYRRTK